ncbi:Ribonuclease pancreatic [Galemys pyrenaicus]|uniref:Ribonuclease pancreatic n=1 Tax=Galemys pyrenaicus TaxID=202257 RepID=A0A8J6AVH4_GALPY|nr:Ribonuclease pancreatic [Galemys pyrenaicus]
MDTTRGHFGPIYCNQMMNNLNLWGKDFNTFVHELMEDIEDVCQSQTSSARISGATTTIHSVKCIIIIACDGNPPVPIHCDGSM